MCNVMKRQLRHVLTKGITSSNASGCIAVMSINARTGFHGIGVVLEDECDREDGLVQLDESTSASSTVTESYSSEQDDVTDLIGCDFALQSFSSSESCSKLVRSFVNSLSDVRVKAIVGDL